MPIHLKSAYEQPGDEDGYRVLVDALWPRGILRDDLDLDAWMREIAPSASLKDWHHKSPEGWPQLRATYIKEMSQSPRRELLEELVERARAGNVTLVFGTPSGEISSATIIAELVQAAL